MKKVLKAAGIVVLTIIAVLIITMIRNSKERVEEGHSLSTFCHRGSDAHILEELLDWDLLCSKFSKYRKIEGRKQKVRKSVQEN